MNTMRIAPRLWILILVTLAVPACVHRAETGKPTGDADHRRVELEAYCVSVEPDPLLGDQIWNAERLFHAAEQRYDAREYAAAAELLGRVVTEFPESRYVAPALLLHGTCELEQRHYEASIPFFEQYLTDFPAGTQRFFAYRGLGEAHAGLNDWAASQKDFEALLALPDLPRSVRDSGRARLARALVEQGRLEDGEAILSELIKRYGPLARNADGLLEPSDTGAMSRYYIGELARRRAEAIVLQDAVDLSRAESELERKAELILAAHEEYFRTFAYDNPRWTAAAAFRMGYIYERFYQDLMSSPAPPELSAEDQALYREAMDEQLVNVVKRAHDLYQQVIRNAERLELEEEWVTRCREGIARLDERVKRIPPKPPAPAGDREKGVREGQEAPEQSP